MADFEDGYKYETQADDDDFEIPDVIEFFIWGVHNPSNVESSLIGFHELEKQDSAVPPIKTHDYKDTAMIITLIENEKTKALHKTRFHGGNSVGKRAIFPEYGTARSRTHEYGVFS